MSRLVVALCCLTVLASLGQAQASPPPAVQRIVFASDRTGDWQLYSILPSGRGLVQLTFGAVPSLCTARECGTTAPRPSPDGRLLLYGHAGPSPPPQRGPIAIARADGRHARVLVPDGRDPSWSRDSRRIVYSSPTGIRVVSTAGEELAQLTTRPFDCAPAWARDGRTVLFIRGEKHSNCGAGELTVLRVGVEQVLADEVTRADWSPDGRRIAYDEFTADGNEQQVLVSRPDGSDRRLIASSASSPVWSPNGRLLAFIALQRGVGNLVRVYDVRTRRTRTLARETWATEPSWSPTSNALVYTAGAEKRTGLRLVPLHGRPRTLYRLYPYGGDFVLGRWTATLGAPAFRRPQEVAPIALPTGNELRLRGGVHELAADGERVAVSFGGIVPDAVSGCNVSLWRPRTRAVVPVGFQVPRGCLTVGSSASTTFSLAFAGGRTAWVERYGGIGIYLQLVGASVSHPFPSFLGSASGCCSGGNPFDGQHVGDIVGGGGLLVFGTWTTACALQPCPGLAPIRGQTIWRIAGGPGRCPGAAFELGNMHCVEVAGSAGALAPLDVDAGRIVAARSDGSLELLDAGGRALSTVPPVAEAPLAAELSGRDLVVLRRGTLSVYDTADSALMHVWPVPDVPSGGPCRTYVGECVEDVRLRLLGAARGLALYLVDGTAHVLNLRDGRDVAVVRADTARLTSAGLFYARTVAGTYPGRVRFVPFGKLPARG